MGVLRKNILNKLGIGGHWKHWRDEITTIPCTALRAGEIKGWVKTSKPTPELLTIGMLVLRHRYTKFP